jgi:beta-barrel assembly-enhancing protease
MHLRISSKPLTSLAISLALALVVSSPLPAQDSAKADQPKVAKQKQTKDAKKDPDKIGDRDVDGNLNWYSLEKEIGLGKGLANELERQAKIVDDPIISEYVNRVGQNLVRNSDCKVPVTIKVIDTEEPNAMALPGGFFYVNSGLLLLADNESELAGVMAHEIAHIAARHGTRQATRGQLVNFATSPLIFMGGWAGFGARQAAGLAVPLGFLKFSRGFEAEADLLGLEYMYKAGYDPTGFVDFFEKLQSMEKRKPGSLSKMFSSHPLTDDRIETAQKNIAMYLKEKPEYVVTTSEFDNAKERLMALQNRRKLDPEDANKPRLRRNTPDTASTPVEGRSGDDKDKTDQNADERPKLKRRQ